MFRLLSLSNIQIAMKVKRLEQVLIRSVWITRRSYCRESGVEGSRGSSNQKLNEFRQRLDEEQRTKRAAFLAGEKARQAAVDLNRLSPMERRIHQLHQEAVDDFKFTYVDPISNLKVVTTYRHFLKGTCCGSACRHCIYQHEAVFEARRQERTFNTSFWRDIDDEK